MTTNITQAQHESTLENTSYSFQSLQEASAMNSILNDKHTLRVVSTPLG